MTAKKTTKKPAKKAAKKTYPSAKKTVPKPKWVTAKELSAIMAENHAKMAKSHAKMAESQAKLAKNHAKTEAAIRELSAENRKLAVEAAKNHAKTEAVIAETSAEVKALAAEIRVLAEEGKETRKVLEETLRTVESTSAEVRELTKNSSRIGNDVGALTEYIVIPKIRLAMNAAGNHTFDSIQTDRIFKKVDDLGEKKTITEVDVLLSGKTEIMAVETKACLMMRDVKKHLDRLEILRQNEELVGIKDKPLLGAVAGAVVDEDVKRFALERGLYVAKIREEEEKLEIEKPEKCRTW